MADAVQQPKPTDAAREAAKWQDRADRFRGTPVAASMRAEAARWRKIAEAANGK